jgi:hypothetical protein
VVWHAIYAASGAVGLFGVLTVITWLTALFGSKKYSGRAMRLLGRPPVEPSVPEEHVQVRQHRRRAGRRAVAQSRAGHWRKAGPMFLADDSPRQGVPRRACPGLHAARVAGIPQRRARR